MEVRLGRSFGHTTTQLPALLQSAMPPSPIITSSRSFLSALPVGWMLNNSTWLKIAAPKKWLVGVYCGHASRQHAQLMQRESTYRCSCSSCEIGGPEPRSCVPSIGTQDLVRLRSSNNR